MTRRQGKSCLTWSTPTIGHQKWMLDDDGVMSHDSGNQDLVWRKAVIGPDAPFVLVPGVSGLKGISPRAHAKDKVDDFFQRSI